MSSITQDVLTNYLNEHLQAEFELDLDRTMATMVDEPFWECVPLNLRVEGHAAVREYYGRLFEGFFPRVTEVTDVGLLLGDGMATLEHLIDFRRRDGSVQRRCYHMAVITAREDGVVSERGYCGPEVAAE